METKSGVVNFTGFVCAAPLLPGCDIGPAIECLSPVTLLAAEIWRDAGSFWVGDRLSPALFLDRPKVSISAGCAARKIFHF